MTVRHRLAGLAALLLLAVVLGACAAAPEPAVETGPSAMADDLVPITYTYGSRGRPAEGQRRHERHPQREDRRAVDPGAH